MKPIIKWHPSFRWTLGILIWVFLITPVSVLGFLWYLFIDILDCFSDRFTELGDHLIVCFGAILLGDEKNS